MPWRSLLAELSLVRDETDARAAAYLGSVPRGEADRRLIIVFGTVMLCLLGIHFFGAPDRPQLTLKALRALSPASAEALAHALRKGDAARLTQRVYWASFRLFFYGVVPLVSARWLLRSAPTELGLVARGISRHARLYFTIIALLAPVVFIASFGEGFQQKYPYYHVAAGEPLWPRFWSWELLYAAQFLALEFFFRGFMVHGLAPSLGFNAVPVMMVPYMMIHFGKPLPEAIASILAGFVLGTLSLKGRSIYWGAVVHVTVACSMDLLSLWHAGRL